MQFLADLWLPILVSGVFVFIASSIAHMVLPYHKGDYRKMPGEEAILSEMRTQNVVPGEYMFPCAGSMKDMNTPEMQAKFKAGPVGHVVVLRPESWNMGKSLLQWFIYTLVVSLLAAYIGYHALGRGADYLAVFRIVGAAAFLGYGVGHLQNSIWKGIRWSTTGKFLFDSVIYALLTAGTFGWLWPSVEVMVG